MPRIGSKFVTYEVNTSKFSFTMMKGSDNVPGDLICKAITKYDIDTVVIGRRSMGGVERFFVGSTSKYGSKPDSANHSDMS
jgi:hypothetical protein